MKIDNLLNRINVNPDIMGGKPVIKGTRITVQLLLKLQSQGMTIDEILQEYPNLKKEDIFASLLFASKTLEDSTFTPLSTKN